MCGRSRANDVEFTADLVPKFVRESAKGSKEFEAFIEEFVAECADFVELVSYLNVRAATSRAVWDCII